MTQADTPKNPPPLTPEVKARRRARLSLSIGTPLYLLCILPWYALRGVTARSLQEFNAIPAGFAFIDATVAAFPLVAALSLLAGWLLFFSRRFPLAYYAALLPLLNLALILLAIVIFTFTLGL